jgi:hypothetical protein
MRNERQASHEPAAEAAGDAMTRTTVLILMMLVASLALAPCASAAGKARRDADMPFALIMDTTLACETPPAGGHMYSGGNFERVPEDKLDHAFQGNAVLMNGKLALVAFIGSDLGVYCETAHGRLVRALLTPWPTRGASAGRLASVRILENNLGAVMLEAGYKTSDGHAYAVQCRLTAGQPIVEIRPGDGTERMVIGGATMSYVAVPGFFGDDMVFSPSCLPRNLVGLPVENMLVALLGGGSTVLAAVWQPAGQKVMALAGKPQGELKTLACDIGVLKDKKLWLAFLEGEGLWHERPLRAEDAGKAVALDWRPPLAAKWRADLVGPRGEAQSWDFSEAAADGPVRIQAGRATVQMPPASGGKVSAGPILIYALDRTQATPLTAFTPVDIMRNTLGIGPCQYVLETEGLASQDNPTPDGVMGWIEKGLRRKKAPDADEVKERLKAMGELVARADARIKRYAALAADAQAILAKAAPAEAPAAQMMGPTLDTIQRAAKAGLGPSAASERAARLAGPLLAAVGKGELTPEFERLAAEVRAIGAAQDRALAKCRMTTRWLKEECGMVAADDPRCDAIARKVFEQIYPILHVGRGNAPAS